VAVSTVSGEQLLYARWLQWGARVGLCLLIGSFLLYLSGLVEPGVPVQQLPQLWTLPVDRYLALTGAPSGWGWLGLLGHSDYLNFLGVAVLASVTVLCYARVAAALFTAGERLLAGLAVAQVLVLVAAASGWFAAGH
jgi:hypothetical protein